MNGMRIDSNLIACNLKALRVKSGLTQDELADLTGYSSRTIRRYETDGVLDLNKVEDFAAFYKVQVSDILFGIE